MNYSAKLITDIYKKGIERECIFFKRLSGLNLDIKFAYGNIYINIGDVFTEVDTGFKNDSIGYGGLSFLGNIGGKTERLLFFKTKELKNVIDKYRVDIDKLNDEISKSIIGIKKQYGEPSPECSILMNRLKN